MYDDDIKRATEAQPLWRDLAREVGGVFSLGTGDQVLVVNVRHHDWTITLDAYVDSAISQPDERAVFTRIRAPYVSTDRFRFRVYEEGFWSKLGKLLGMQDIEVGDPEFDRKFVVKSNKDEQVARFFEDAQIREIFLAHPSIFLEVGEAEGRYRTPHVGQVYELYHRERKVVADLTQLTALHDLCSRSLDRLLEMGSAWDEAPALFQGPQVLLGFDDQ